MSPLAKMPLVTEWLRKIMYPKATGIIAQTQFAKSILYQKTKASNIVVINNPVNPINRLEVPIKNRIVTVGRLSPEKGHRFLLQAFAKLNQPDWDLSIVGDGVEKENLVNLTKELKISHKVIFHGHLKDFSQQLSEAQIFVLPSLKEGFPNALLEAMSVPLACIASDTFNGNHEIIINGENGLLVKPGNVEDLYKAIENLINNPNLRARLKINAYKIREKLDFSIIAHKYLNVITNAYAIKKKFK
jgi:glycosyltransferase involved in cell wall biosynthesis